MLSLISPAFSHNGTIPSKYTCDGQNISPPLEISGVPAETKSLVLIMDDPDVPKHIREDGLWIHWVKFNIPPTTTTIPEGVEPKGVSGKGTHDTMTYEGPCPPDREHRYFFKLYALDTVLELAEGVSKTEVEAAMVGHIIEQAELIGRYNRKQ